MQSTVTLLKRRSKLPGQRRDVTRKFWASVIPGCLKLAETELDCTRERDANRYKEKLQFQFGISLSTYPNSSLKLNRKQSRLKIDLIDRNSL